MKTLMLYEIAPDGLAKVPAHYEAHARRMHEFHARGVMLLSGPYGMPPVGAAAVFTSDEAAREFIAGDPFVLEGIVARYSVHPWDEALG